MSKILTTKTFRPLPPVPDLEISEELVLGAADVMRVWINRLSSVAHDIAVGRNLKLFVQVSLFALNFRPSYLYYELGRERIYHIGLQIAVSLWIISYIGGFFNFITMVYIGEFLYGLSWHDSLESFQRVIGLMCLSALIFPQAFSLVYQCLCCTRSTRIGLMRS